eukprot:COSAG04_NODE_3142_length_3126_cov_1.779650_1_plen_356_part_00
MRRLGSCLRLLAPPHAVLLSALGRGGGMRLALLGLLAHGPLVAVRPPPASPLSRPAAVLRRAMHTRFLHLPSARLKLPAVLAAAGVRAGVAGGEARQGGDGAAARRARPSRPAPPLARLARRLLVAHARGSSHAPPSAMRRCGSARRSARARRRRGERVGAAYARPPPSCWKVRPRVAPPASPCLCQHAVVSPRLAPSLDLTDAVTLFQAPHVCKSDEGVVGTGKVILDAPKISASVAACWHCLTSFTQQLACGKAFAARAHQQKYTELQNQPALCATSSDDSDCRSARCQSPCSFGPCSHRNSPTRSIRSSHTRSHKGSCISRVGTSRDARSVSGAWLCGSSVRIFSRRVGCLI